MYVLKLTLFYHAVRYKTPLRFTWYSETKTPSEGARYSLHAVCLVLRCGSFLRVMLFTCTKRGSVKKLSKQKIVMWFTSMYVEVHLHSSLLSTLIHKKMF
ncbi:hypothetical protein VPH35_104408 [Triticum aestivum]